MRGILISAEGAMRIDIVAVVPELLESPLGYSIVGRARKKGILDVQVHALRNYAHDARRNVDDYSFGPGAGDRKSVV